jgi:hypothetical protein
MKRPLSAYRRAFSPKGRRMGHGTGSRLDRRIHRERLPYLIKYGSRSNGLGDGDARRCVAQFFARRGSPSFRRHPCFRDPPCEHGFAPSVPALYRPLTNRPRRFLRRGVDGLSWEAWQP